MVIYDIRTQMEGVMQGKVFIKRLKSKDIVKNAIPFDKFAIERIFNVGVEMLLVYVTDLEYTWWVDPDVFVANKFEIDHYRFGLSVEHFQITRHDALVYAGKEDKNEKQGDGLPRVLGGVQLQPVRRAEKKVAERK